MENFIKNRKNELAEGIQLDISEYGRQCGLPLALYTTSRLWESVVKPDEQGVKKGETEIKRLGTVINKLIYSIRVYRQNNRSNVFGFEVDLTRNGASESIKLISSLGQISDVDENPCITILLPEELENSGDNEQTKQ